MALTDSILYKYQNGNVSVTILEDGTKIREYEDIPIIVHPESIDVKITNKCDLNCPYCHENSNDNGKHANLLMLLQILQDLPAGVELAIGGGNPLEHPQLIEFLKELKNRGLIANITVNQNHLSPYFLTIKSLLEQDLIKGLGISIVNNDYTAIKELQELTNNIVFHVIVGVNDINILNDLSKLKYCKVLILGYKQFGRGNNFYSKQIQKDIDFWKRILPFFIKRIHLSFDNLALEQMDIQQYFSPEIWESLYMGDDFTFTMYIDAVNQKYAPTSRSSKRISFSTMTLINYFQHYKK